MRIAATLLLAIGLLLGCRVTAVAEKVANKEFCLKLPSGDAVPCLDQAAWADGERAFRGEADAAAWWAWLAGTLAEGEMRPEGSWTIEAGPIFQNARRSMRCGDLQVTCHVELAGGGTIFRTYTELKNLGSQPVGVDRFPVWKDRWLLPPGEISIRWWDSLTFEPHETPLSPGKHVALHSDTYSSQQTKSGGNLPFWHLWAGQRHLFFSLAWCGGWKADVRETPEGTSFEIMLPPEETGLVLAPGEAIPGPIVLVTAIRSPDAGDARAQWLRQREALDKRLYGGPKPWYPLLYNHWYAARADFDLPFLQRQLKELPSWGFDLFVLDHGWFEKPGDWRPARAKFQPGELEGFYDEIRKKGLKAGIWSCPWLQAVDDGQFPPEIDEPHFYQRFMHAYSLDMAGIDFARRLVDHIALLESQFHVDWWKYDQELFGPKSRHGRMKNVVALQDALLAVRRAYPELNIENCMSGGRMINALTDGIVQSHWIRDGGHTGLAHARSNLKEALGAADLLPLAKVQRWTNRPDEIDPADVELLKMYCRSAMVGAWGISGDLTKIAPEARRVILAEVEHYRRLTEFKGTHRYEILYPRDESKIAGIVLYDLPACRAAVLLFRWQEDGPISEKVRLPALPRESDYAVADADTGATRRQPGAELVRTGLTVSFEPSRRSAIYWVEPVP